MRRKRIMKKGLAIFAAMMLTVSNCAMITYAENDTEYGSTNSSSSDSSGSSSSSDSSGSSSSSSSSSGSSSSSSGSSESSSSSDSSGSSSSSSSSSESSSKSSSSSGSSTSGSANSGSGSSSDSSSSSGSGSSSDSTGNSSASGSTNSGSESSSKPSDSTSSSSGSGSSSDSTGNSSTSGSTNSGSESSSKPSDSTSSSSESGSSSSDSAGNSSTDGSMNGSMNSSSESSGSESSGSGSSGLESSGSESSSSGSSSKPSDSSEAGSASDDTKDSEDADSSESGSELKEGETAEGGADVNGDLSQETQEGQEGSLTENEENPLDTLENPEDTQLQDEVPPVSLESADIPVDNISNYQGVYIDSDFSDWDGVSKTEVNNDYIKESAMVYEGDYVYLYLHTNDPHAADLDGLSYDLLTDLGQHNKFNLVYDQEQGIYTITGIDGAEIQFSDLTWGNENGYYYEISIPISSLQKTNESLSFGIYLDDTFNEMVTGVGMTDTGNGTVVTEPNYSAISFDDDSYSDWDYIPKTTIQYSTDYSQEGVTDGYSAIYSNGDVAFGYVETSMPGHLNVQDITKAVTIAINRDSALDNWNAGSSAIQFKYIAVDQNGKMTTVSTESLPNGTYQYYLVDVGAGVGGYATFQEFLEKGSQWGDYCYGEARLTVNDSIGQMEYALNLNNLAAKFGLASTNDIMTISAQYGRIGQQWTTCAGTSTGPWMGLALCGIAVAAVYLQRNKKDRLDGCFA